MRIGLVVFALVGCGKVERHGDAGDADSDTDVDVDVDVDVDTDVDTDSDSDSDTVTDPHSDVCDPFCAHATKCGWPEGDEAFCASDCACLADQLDAEERTSYFACTQTTDCGSVDATNTLEEACGQSMPADGMSPLGGEYLANCDSANAGCDRVPCDLQSHFSDDAIDELAPCLAEASCNDIMNCNAGARGRLCF